MSKKSKKERIEEKYENEVHTEQGVLKTLHQRLEHLSKAAHEIDNRVAEVTLSLDWREGWECKVVDVRSELVDGLIDHRACSGAATAEAAVSKTEEQLLGRLERELRDARAEVLSMEISRRNLIESVTGKSVVTAENEL